MAFFTNFIDTIANFPTRFFVGGVSTIIEQNWDITQIGTKDKAEYFNEIQKNGLYTTIGTKSSVTGGEVYTLDLQNYDDFGAYDINLLMTVVDTNTTSNLTLRIGTNDYPIKKQQQGVLVNLSIKELKGTQLITVRNGVAIIQIAPIYDLISGISGGAYGGYIQDIGTKIAGNTYIDSNTGNIMLCLNTTTSASPNSDFTIFTNKSLLEKVQSLDKDIAKMYVSTVGSAAVTYTKVNREFHRIQVTGSGKVEWTINTNGNPVGAVAANGSSDLSNAVSLYRIEYNNKLVGGYVNIVSSPCYINVLVDSRSW